MSGIQRDSEATQLRRVIYNSDLSEGEPSRPKVSICDLSGTGGVGKTFLASYVLDSEELAKRAYCTLKLDGQAANLRGDFMGLVEQRLCSKSIATPAQPEKDYFPRLRNLADDYTAMLEEVEVEFRQKSSPNKEIETIKPELASRQALLVSLLKAGYLINKVVPVTQKYLNFSELPMKKDDAEAAIQFLCAEARDLEALKSPTPGILRRRFNRVFGVPGKYRMRRQLHDLTAEYIMSDLRKVIAGLTSKRRERLVGKRDFEFERLLIVIDDFEVIGPVLAPFLFGSLLPLLRNADFETVLLIIGLMNAILTRLGGMIQGLPAFLHIPVLPILGTLSLKHKNSVVLSQMFSILPLLLLLAHPRKPTTILAVCSIKRNECFWSELYFESSRA